MEPNAKPDKTGTIKHFLLLLAGFITALVGISYLVTELMK
jgi:hypothetical protein